MEAVRIETYERNKAETLSTVLKETIEAKKDLEDNNGVDDIVVENMVLDDCADEWKKHKSAKNQKLKEKSDSCFSCNQCDNNFITQIDLKEHLKVHEIISNKEGINCNKCEKVYGTMSKLRRHDWRSHREVECNVCGEILESRQIIICFSPPRLFLCPSN